MKIRAIRVADVGRFSQPVALERLSGGLDVLCGPNELGKSTLFQALKYALLVKHSSRQAEIADLRPYGGGSPTVEVDFETAGELWRIRKRYLAQASAELTRPGRESTLRGADAETRLAELVGNEGTDGHFRLLWVRQQDATGDDRRGSEAIIGARSAIDLALAEEIGAVAEGRLARAVHDEVRCRLGELVTATGRPKAHGPLDTALKSAERLKLEASSAAQRLDVAERRLAELADISQRQRNLADPAAREARADALAKAQAALETARAATERRDRAAQALKAAVSELKMRQATAASLASQERELAEAGALLAAEDQKSPGLDARLAEGVRLLEGAQTAATEARARLDALGAEHAAAVAAERRSASGIRLRELELREKEFGRVAAESALLRQSLSANPATAALVEAARREARDIANLEAQRDAAAPRVQIVYAPGARAHLTVDGRPIGDGETLQAATTLAIEVPGIGRIRVSPGGSAALDDIAADLEAHRAQLRALLTRAGAADLDGLESLARDRSQAEASLAQLASRTSALAPGGVEALRAEIEALTRVIAALPSQEARSVEAVEADRRSAAQEAAARQSSLDELAAVAAAARAEVTGHKARLGALRERHDALVAKLPASAELDAHRQQLTTMLESARQATHELQRELSVWTEAAPSAESMTKLEAELSVAIAAEAAAEREIAESRTAAARIEGELVSMRNEDVAARAQEAADALAIAQASLAEISDEVAALRLLDSELAAEEAAAREQYVAPVLAKLMPLVSRVLPEAKLSLDQGLSPDGVLRNGIAEPVRRLSDGTREQIAVLSRLGFARLFADAGRPLPVILDDAMVYSDDMRIAQMFEVLQAAAEHHQVIVLTCRAKAFEGLGGTRLALSPWTGGHA